MRRDLDGSGWARRWLPGRTYRGCRKFKFLTSMILKWLFKTICLTSPDRCTCGAGWLLGRTYRHPGRRVGRGPGDFSKRRTAALALELGWIHLWQLFCNAPKQFEARCRAATWSESCAYPLQRPSHPPWCSSRSGRMRSRTAALTLANCFLGLF